MARLFRFSIGGDFDTVEQYNLAVRLKSYLRSIGTIHNCVNTNKLIDLWYTFCDLKNIEDRKSLSNDTLIEFAIYLSGIEV
jgi:hypothetical protein